MFESIEVPPSLAQALLRAKGRLHRWDFDTEEEGATYNKQKEAMPKAAFQFGVKMQDGRKTRKQNKDQKLTNELHKINKILARQRCKGIVVVPVFHQISFNWDNLSSDFGVLLKNGFQLQWPNETSGGCDRCERSDGRCGYKQTDNTSWDFVCFCSDRMRDRHCEKLFSYQDRDELGLIVPPLQLDKSCGA